MRPERGCHDDVHRLVVDGGDVHERSPHAGYVVGLDRHALDGLPEPRVHLCVHVVWILHPFPVGGDRAGSRPVSRLSGEFAREPRRRGHLRPPQLATPAPRGAVVTRKDDVVASVAPRAPVRARARAPGPLPPEAPLALERPEAEATAAVRVRFLDPEAPRGRPAAPERRRHVVHTLLHELVDVPQPVVHLERRHGEHRRPRPTAAGTFGRRLLHRVNSVRQPRDTRPAHLLKVRHGSSAFASCPR